MVPIGWLGRFVRRSSFSAKKKKTYIGSMLKRHTHATDTRRRDAPNMDKVSQLEASARAHAAVNAATAPPQTQVEAKVRKVAIDAIKRLSELQTQRARVASADSSLPGTHAGVRKSRNGHNTEPAQGVAKHLHNLNMFSLLPVLSGSRIFRRVESVRPNQLCSWQKNKMA